MSDEKTVLPEAPKPVLPEAPKVASVLPEAPKAAAALPNAPKVAVAPKPAVARPAAPKVQPKAPAPQFNIDVNKAASQSPASIALDFAAAAISVAFAILIALEM